MSLSMTSSLFFFFLLQSSANQIASVDAGNAPNGQVQPYERSLTPILPDFRDPALCYVPNGYSPAPFYYGGKLFGERCGTFSKSGLRIKSQNIWFSMAFM